MVELLALSGAKGMARPTVLCGLCPLLLGPGPSMAWHQAQSRWMARQPFP